MTIKIVPIIACFILAVLMSGCQESSLDSSGLTKQDPVEVQQDVTIIAYYFHRTMRCPTCIAIEANAARVIEDNFPQQLTDEKLMWIPYNLDDPGGDGLEKEFDLSVNTLVLAKMQDGNYIKHKKLEKVWDLIGNPEGFDKYVQKEVTLFLNE